MSCDLGLSDEDRNRITMTIRRTIRDYVFDRLGNFLRVLTRDKDTHGKEDVLKEDTRLKIKFPYVFDSNFEQQLGKKTYRQGKTSRKLKEIKSLPTSFEFKEHKEDSYVETRRKIKNTNEDKNRSAFGLLDNMTNKKILFYNPSKILISKKILKYTPSDKVVIMKSDIEPYMKQNEEDKAGHKEECSENTNDHNEQNEQGLIPNGRHTPERSYPNSKEECNDMELNEDVEVKIEDL